MSGKLRCGIVGCGGIAQVHAHALDALETAELLAFADIKPERAEALAQKYGGKAYHSLEAMLDHEDLQVLHICTPHYLHLPMAQEAARRGLQVFTEKPPVISYEQWEQFKELEGRARVGICFQNRFNDSVGFLPWGLIESGKAGELLGARAFVTWRREAPYYTESGWRGALATEGGGALINQAIHTLDLMVRFLGPGHVLGASLANRHLKGVIEVEDTLEAAIDFSGRRGLFYATTAYCTDAPIILELVCGNAAIRIEGEEVTLRWQDGTVERRDFSRLDAVTGKSYWGSSHQRCIAEFYDCVLEGREFLNDIPGVEDSIRLMLDIYEDARADAR